MSFPLVGSPSVRRQPAQPTGIDWSNPIAYGLQRAWMARFPYFEAVSQNVVQQSGVSFIENGLGGASNFSTASAAIDVGSVAAISRPITIRIRWIAHAASMATHMLANMPAASGTGFRIEAYTTLGGVYVVPTYNGVANLPAPAYNFSDFGSRAVMEYVAVMSSTALDHYINGAFLGTSAAATFTSAAAGSTLKIGAASGIGQVSSVDYWGRLLTPAEISSLYERPWQLYRRPVSRMYPFTLAGGAASGAGSSSLTFAASAAGAANKPGAGSSSITFSASAVGSANKPAAGSSSITFGASAVGDVGGNTSGAGSSSITFGASAVGASIRAAAGSSSITFGAQGVSTAPATETATRLEGGHAPAARKRRRFILPDDTEVYATDVEIRDILKAFVKPKPQPKVKGKVARVVPLAEQVSFEPDAKQDAERVVLRMGLATWEPDQQRYEAMVRDLVVARRRRRTVELLLMAA